MWQYTMLVPIPFLVIYMLSGCWFPESPKHLYQTLRNEEAARKAGTFFWGTDEIWPVIKQQYDREMTLTKVSKETVFFH